VSHPMVVWNLPANKIVTNYKEHNMSRYLAYCSRKELSNMISPCAELFQKLIPCTDCALRFRL